jgi:tetratricopeptide (TPR) repeat protein
MRQYFAVVWIVLLFSTFAFYSPSHAVTSDEYYQAGLSLFTQNQYAQSVDYFKAAVQLDPMNWRAQQGLGNAYYQMNRLSEAVAAYDQSLALNNDPVLRAFVDSIRGAALPGAAPLAALPGAGMAVGEKEALDQFKQGAEMQEKARQALNSPGFKPLSREGANLAKYGAPRFSKDNHKIQFSFQIGSAALGGFDVGYSLNPMTNVGLSFLYIPLSSQSLYTFEPRIKFYSSPSDLSFFLGLGCGVGLVTDYPPYYPDETPYGGYNWFAPNIKLGFSMLEDSALLFELDWSIGVAFVTHNEYSYGYGYYDPVTHTYKYESKKNPQSYVFPFPVPGLRIGLAI